MKVLLIGSGGREHALALKISQSPLCEALFIAPGNPGTARLGTNTPLNIADHAGVARFCREEGISLVVVGPEAPLVAGIADDLSREGIAVFGPSRAAARLEGSKDFTKALCAEAGVPTAAYATFTALEPALAHVRAKGAPIVVKYDGLMAGKGVTVAATLAEAEAALRALYAAEAEASVVIEECLTGEEASFFCLVDGETVIPFGSAQDHKRVFDGDRGPNTGGMGAYSPAPVVTPEVERRALAEIVLPSMRAIARRGTPYRGVIFAGLMIDASGAPQLIEYNCRFGDPECQVLMLRLESDLLPLLDATARGQLAGRSIVLKPVSAVGVVMAAKGYPGDFEKGGAIGGLDAVAAIEGVCVIHAGTRAEGATIPAAAPGGTGGEKIVVNGGRVLTVCGVGRDLFEARERAYRGGGGSRLARRLQPFRYWREGHGPPRRRGGTADVDLILAVDVSRTAARDEGQRMPGVVETGFRVIDLMQAALADAQVGENTSRVCRLKAPVEDFNALDFFSARQILAASESLAGAVEAIIAQASQMGAFFR